MNQTSPVNTATAVGAGAVVAPVVSYVASLLHVAMPADVQSAIVVLLVAGAHWLSQRIPARAANPAATPAQ
jgi:hypothetical protein